MLPKPDACLGCPMYQTGQGFVPDDLVPDSKVFILAQNPGADEERGEAYVVRDHTIHYEDTIPKPLIGKTGYQMDTQFLPLAGLERKDVSVGNILKCRWNGGNDLPPDDILQQSIQTCTTRHLRIPSNINLVVVQGAVGFQYVSKGEYRKADGRAATVTDYRGFVLPDKLHGIPCYQVLHIAGLDRQTGKKAKGGLTPAQRWVARRIDWPKIKKVLDGTIPQELPPRIIVQADNSQEWQAWFHDAESSEYVVCDTEYTVDSRYLTVLGLLWKRGNQQCGLQVDWRNTEGWVKAGISRHLQRLVQQVPLVVHNFQADIPILEKWGGVPRTSYKQIIDTLQMHGVMWSEMPHTLEFLASVYGVHPKMKHLSTVDLLLYNFGDLVDTASVYEGIRQEFKCFPAAERIYQSQQEKLIPIWLQGTLEHGIKINQAEVQRLVPTRQTTVAAATRLATSMVGRPLNLGSDEQVGHYLYVLRNYPIQRRKDTGNPTVDQDALATLRRAYCPPWDERVEPTIETALQRIEEGADPIIELKVVYEGVQNDLSNYLNRLLNKSGGVIDRVYPSIGMPQKTGRWALVDPPISTTPPSLRSVYVPDEGYTWICWDWSGIENWMLRYLTGSEVYKNAQDRGYDLHTWTACTILGYEYPPNMAAPFSAPINEAWRQRYQFYTGADKRRVELGKGARFEMVYGGTGANVAQSAARYGLTARAVKAGVQRLLEADQHYYAWRTRAIEAVRKSGITQTFMGRPWIHTGLGSEVEREALNHPMQGGVVDVAHTTMILIWEKYKHLGAWFSHGLHDSQYWSFPTKEVTSSLCNDIKAIVTREFDVEGVKAHFPAEFHLINDKGEELAWLT